MDMSELGGTATPALYGAMRGRYSEDELTTAVSVNSLLGLVTDTDVFLGFHNDINGLTVHGIPADNVARVIKMQPACNGLIYSVDTLLLPASTSEELPGNYWDAATTASVLLNASTCAQSVVEAGMQQSFASRMGRIWATGLLSHLLR